MFKDTSWQRFFTPTILERGHNYFLEDAVADLNFHQNSVTATVYGSDDYEVEITFQGDRIDDMYCTCPYAEDGNYCKHMAALLFELEDCSEQELAEDDANTYQDEVRQVVMQADETAAKNFLTVLLQEDEKLFARFKALVSPELSPSDIQRFKKQVDALIRRCEGRYGFIEYRAARGFIREMDEFLEEDVQAMLEGGQLREAFELTNHIFSRSAAVDMDDSDGGLGMIGDHCLEVWNEIADRADDLLRREMFEWFISRTDGSVVGYMAEFIDNILETQFTEQPYLERLLALTEEKAREADELTHSEDSWGKVYYASTLIKKHINLMEKSGCSWKEIREYCRHYWKYSDVRQYFINGCTKRGNYGAAIKALKESLKLDANYRGLIVSNRHRLKELYKKTGDEESYRKELWNLVTKDDTGNMQEYRELKGLYSPQEWESVRETVLAALPKYVHMEDYYKEEKMYDKLLEAVLNHWNFYNAARYLELLKDRYPKQLLAKYSEEVQCMAKRTADRKAYQQWVQILRTMQTIPGGKEEVTQIVKQWKLAYGNRRAMMDELSRL